MAKTYTYDPSKIGVNGLDKMRFELGDTNVENGGTGAAICDEEINAVLTAHPSRWKLSKLKVVESIYRRFSYEVTFGADGLSMQFQQRAAHWKSVYDGLLKEVNGIGSLSISTESMAAAGDDGHYFYSGMMDNPGSASGSRRDD